MILNLNLCQEKSRQNLAMNPAIRKSGHRTWPELAQIMIDIEALIVFLASQNKNP
jgi:hypothetical protein